MSYITQKQLDAALLPIKTDVTALKSSVTALQNPVVTAPPPPSTGTTGSTGTTPPIVIPPSAGSILKVDFVGKTLTQILALPGIQHYEDVYNGRNLLEVQSDRLRLILPANTNQMPHLFQNFAAAVKNYRFKVTARMKPGFTTLGGVPQPNNDAAALKVLGPGWNTADGRGTLDLTNTNQYQVSLDAKDRVSGVYFMTNRNSGDNLPWGHQVLEVKNEWTDGLDYTYEIEEHWPDARTVKLDGWVYLAGTTRSVAPQITITNVSTDRDAPLANKMEIFFHFNQQRGFETYIDVAGWELIQL